MHRSWQCAALKVSTEKIPESQVVMTIEVEPERLDDAREKALRKLAPRAKVPGFRPGKAPAAMVRRYFGEERILDEALDVLVPDVYREAVEADESIDPIARPRLVVETTEPLVVKATIPVRPTVELGDYQAVRVETEAVTVDERARRRDAASAPPARRDARADRARAALARRRPHRRARPTVEGETLVEQQDVEVQLDEDRDVLFPGFEEAAARPRRRATTLEFDLAVPDDRQRREVRRQAGALRRQDPRDEGRGAAGARRRVREAVGDGFESVDALRDRIRDDIREDEEEQLDNRYHDEILDQLVERATIEFPPVMLDAEVDRLLHDQAGHIERGARPRALPRRASARPRSRCAKSCGPIADTAPKAIAGAVAGRRRREYRGRRTRRSRRRSRRLTASAGAQAEQLRQLFDSEDGRGTIRRNLLTRKTLARLVEIATQDGGAKPTEPKKPKHEAAQEEGTAERAPKSAGEPCSRATAQAGHPESRRDDMDVREDTAT